MIRSLALRKQRHHLELSNDAALHVQATLLCLSDLFSAFNYVEPHDNNKSAFSHRFYELLLRGCTEFESVCKTILLQKTNCLPKRATIQNYHELVTHFPLQNAGVSIQVWNPEPIEIWPFDEWTIAKAPFWYKAYNSVKHSRRENFGDANLINASFSICAAITLLTVAYGEQVFCDDSVITWSAEGMHYTACAERRIVLCRKMPKNLYIDGSL
jgi:hypothetical protein